MFTKSVEARRKVAVSTPPSVISTSAKDCAVADVSNVSTVGEREE